MDTYLELAALTVGFLAFFVVTFIVIMRTHGIPLREQFGSLTWAFRQAYVNVATSVVPARRLQRMLFDRHLAFCAKASGSRTVLALARAASEGPRQSELASHALEDAVDAHEDAIDELRTYLGTLADEDIVLLVRGMAFIYFSNEIDEFSLREFFLRERDTADDASRDEIVDHYLRFSEAINGPREAACQAAKKPL